MAYTEGKSIFDSEYADAGYRLEAKIIGEYILASDAVLADALRENLTKVIRASVEQVWSRGESSRLFQRRLAEYFAAEAKKVVEAKAHAELYEPLKAEMLRGWHDVMERALRDGIRDYLKGRVKFSDTDLGQNAVKKKMDTINAGRLMNHSATQAMERTIKDELGKQLERGLSQHFKAAGVNKLIKTGLAKQIYDWKAWMLMLLLFLAVGLGGLLNYRLQKNVNQYKEIDVQVKGLAAQIETLVKTGPGSGGRGGTSLEIRSQDEISQNLHGVQDEKSALKAAFGRYVGGIKSAPKKFQEIQANTDNAFNQCFPVDDWPRLSEDVKSLKSEPTERKELFSFESSKLTDSQAIFILQALSWQHENLRGKAPNGFSFDGGWGTNTANLCNRVLAKIEANDEPFFSNESNSNPSKQELLLAIYLILSGLESK